MPSATAAGPETDAAPGTAPVEDGGVPTRTREQIDTLLADVGAVAAVERLTGGLFATTYRVTLVGGRRLVVKTAPTATDRLLTYEHDLLRTEAEVYRIASGRSGLLMPAVVKTDFSRQVLPGDVLVVEHLGGVPLTDLRAEGDLSSLDEQRIQYDLGAFMARLHTVHGTRFGYPNAEAGLVGGTWPDAFGRMVEALLADAHRWGTLLPHDRIRTAVARHRAALAEVTVPSLVHTDLWSGNLFVDPSTVRLTGVIDTERSVWGDPLLELAGADQTGRGPVPEALVAGYAAEAGDLPLGTPSGEVRLLLYRLYMALVLTVEITPRGYSGDGVRHYRSVCEANVVAALDALA
jgi:aminoglycoside phosphotransferase (APT) family kinase protein